MSEISPSIHSRATPPSYSPAQIGLHWLIAALVIFQLVFGESIKDYGHVLRDGKTPETLVWLMGNLHIWVGVAVLVLALARLGLRVARGAPPAPDALHPHLVTAMKSVYVLFYVLLIGAPLTGLAAWYLGIHISGEIHETLKPVFIVLISLHVLAALWHRFVLKDDVMARMLPTRR
ncbi:cytochrome b [Stappia sp. ICDLI1TA098]